MLRAVSGLDDGRSPFVVRGLRKAYADVVAVDGVNLEARAGECFGLLGPNGTGKTPTIEICDGLRETDAGHVAVLGRTWDCGASAFRQQIGISLQETRLSEKSTMENASGLMNAAMLPMWILSGVFFSSSNFPQVMQPSVKALPLTAVNDALRANMLQGTPIAGMLPELAAIAVWTVGCFALACRLFRWR